MAQPCVGPSGRQPQPRSLAHRLPPMNRQVSSDKAGWCVLHVIRSLQTGVSLAYSKTPPLFFSAAWLRCNGWQGSLRFHSQPGNDFPIPRPRRLQIHLCVTFCLGGSIFFASRGKTNPVGVRFIQMPSLESIFFFLITMKNFNKEKQTKHWPRTLFCICCFSLSYVGFLVFALVTIVFLCYTRSKKYTLWFKTWTETLGRLTICGPCCRRSDWFCGLAGNQQQSVWAKGAVALQRCSRLDKKLMEQQQESLTVLQTTVWRERERERVRGIIPSLMLICQLF